MNRHPILGIAAAALMALMLQDVHADAVADALDDYRAQGVGTFDATAGESRWRQAFPDPAGGGSISCASCHGEDLREAGRHLRTRKPIEPMAPSVNSARLTDRGKIEKWFLRNCKGTWGRECTPQEKGDFLLYLRQQ